MKLTFKICTLFFLLFGLVSCSGGEKPDAKKNTTTPKANVEKDNKSDEMAAIIKNGKKLYVQHCSACHMPKGDGIPGLNPPLINTEYVTGDKERLIGIVINGLTEEIEVNGQTYKGPMIGLPYLKDKEISDILTYVRDRFGKGASPVTEEEVTAARG